ncbi:hypothetical protein RI054_26g107980 [Pseudoscourfieldia marina]
MDPLAQAVTSSVPMWPSRKAFVDAFFVANQESCGGVRHGVFFQQFYRSTGGGSNFRMTCLNAGCSFCVAFVRQGPHGPYKFNVTQSKPHTCGADYVIPVPSPQPAQQSQPAQPPPPPAAQPALPQPAQQSQPAQPPPPPAALRAPPPAALQSQPAQPPPPPAAQPALPQPAQQSQPAQPPPPPAAQPAQPAQPPPPPPPRKKRRKRDTTATTAATPQCSWTTSELKVLFAKELSNPVSQQAGKQAVSYTTGCGLTTTYHRVEKPRALVSGALSTRYASVVRGESSGKVVDSHLLLQNVAKATERLVTWATKTELSKTQTANTGAAASYVAAFDEPTETPDAVITAILVTLGGPTARHAPIPSFDLATVSGQFGQREKDRLRERARKSLEEIGERAKASPYPFAQAIQVLRRAAKDGILQVTVPPGGLSRDNVGAWNALEELASWNAIIFLKRAQREEEEREKNGTRALVRVVAGSNLDKWGTLSPRQKSVLQKITHRWSSWYTYESDSKHPMDPAAVYAATMATNLATKRAVLDAEKLQQLPKNHSFKVLHDEEPMTYQNVMQCFAGEAETSIGGMREPPSASPIFHVVVRVASGTREAFVSAGGVGAMYLAGNLGAEDAEKFPLEEHAVTDHPVLVVTPPVPRLEHFGRSPPSTWSGPSTSTPMYTPAEYYVHDMQGNDPNANSVNEKKKRKHLAAKMEGQYIKSLQKCSQAPQTRDAHTLTQG